MSYIDDPEMEWNLEPNDEVPPWSLEEMMDDMAGRKWDGLRIILQGYAGLKQRHPEASDEECLRTSMIWMYG